MVKTYAHTIVVPEMDYWKQTIEGKKGDQLERMKVVRIFNPLHVLGNKISESDIDGFKKFKFYDHPEKKGRMVRGRTLSTYLIGGSQTVQRCQDSRTCSVQC